MKKLLTASFCVLLASSALVQSCKKPDAAPDTDPIDSSQVVVPVTPKTEQEIIQWAVNKLPGKYLMTGRKWNFMDITIYDQPDPVGPRTRATDTSGPNYQGGNPVLTTKEIDFPYTSHVDSNLLMEFITFGIKNSTSSFYNKIFVDEVGDSFIALMCTYHFKFTEYCRSGQISLHDMKNHNEPLAEVNVKDFLDVSKFNNMKIDSGNYSAFYEGLDSPYGNPSTKGRFPTYQVKYYYNKDSLVLFQADYRNTNYARIGANRVVDGWRYTFGYNYGVKIK